MHKLNKCTAFLARITIRHNLIAKVITDSIKNLYGYNTPPLNENSSPFIPDLPPLPDRSKNFRTDIWFINEDRISHRKTVNIIEITCPYSMMFDTPSGRKSTLEIRRTNKINKYTPLIDDICSSWNVDACLHIIVVSSLGAVPKETIKKLRNIFHSDKRAISVARRCAIAAIIGSWAVFYDKDLNTPFLNSLDRNNDLTDSSQNHLTDEEDGDIL